MQRITHINIDWNVMSIVELSHYSIWAMQLNHLKNYQQEN